MVDTYVIDVLPDGVIIQMCLAVHDVVEIYLERDNVDYAFAVKKVKVLSNDKTSIEEAIREINTTLKVYGVNNLEIKSTTGGRFQYLYNDLVL